MASNLTVGVMQPYWAPYLGYFRLMHAVDVFVVLDDVQFPRRGFVHRNKFRRQNLSEDWVTLPILKASQKTLISELEFHPDADSLIEKQTSRFPVLSLGFGVIDNYMRKLEGLVVPLLVDTMQEFMKCLELDCDFVLSSELHESSSHGQKKILNLVKAVGGERYINSPGGRDLYDETLFKKNGVKLEFLPPWEGVSLSILEECKESFDFLSARTQIISQSLPIP